MPEPTEREGKAPPLDRADLTALLGAFCFFLSAIEYMIPKPLPFMRLGIANLPILLAVDLLPLRWFLVLALVKVVGMSVISGSLFTYIALFSLSGTLVAALVMWVARRTGGKAISAVGVSVVGAMASNAVQVVLARFFVIGEAAWYIAPVFLAMGLITGTILGLFAERFVVTSKWYARASGKQMPEGKPTEGLRAASGATNPVGGKEKTARIAARRLRQARKEAAKADGRARRGARAAGYDALFAPGALAATGLLCSLAFLFQPLLSLKAVLFSLFLLAALASGKRISLGATIVVSLGIIAANLLVPIGQVVLDLGGFKITRDALRGGIEKALTFEGLLYISKATIRPGIRLRGRFGSIVARAFVYFDRIIEYRGKPRAATFFADADSLMLAVWDAPKPEGSGTEAPPVKPGIGYILESLVVVLSISALVAGHFPPR